MEYERILPKYRRNTAEIEINDPDVRNAVGELPCIVACDLRLELPIVTAVNGAAAQISRKT